MPHKLRALLVMNEARRDDVYPKRVMERLRGLVDFTQPPMSREQLTADAGAMQGVDILISSWGAPLLDAPFLSNSPQLKAVFIAAGSIKGIVTEDFWLREVPIVSAASANAIPVAEYTVAQVILGLKQAAMLSRTISATGSYPARPRVAGGYGSRVGVISLGAIGRTVAKMLQAFDVEVVAYDPMASPKLARELGCSLLSLPELFSSSNAVTVHSPLLPETTGMVNQGLLESMIPYSVFINTARGALVNESDLVDVLSRRSDLTAMLDVTWPEPPRSGSRLYELSNVFLTPHMAGAQGAECARMGDLVVDELERFLRGDALLHAVTRLQEQARA